jgi:hypothetical protein
MVASMTLSQAFVPRTRARTPRRPKLCKPSISLTIELGRALATAEEHFNREVGLSSLLLSLMPERMQLA